MDKFRIETDYLGEVSIPSQSYWGIHTYRAVQNFPVSGYKVHPEFIKAFGFVKLACAKVTSQSSVWGLDKSKAIIQACEELASGVLNNYIIVDALQGGAGTSLNMNVNEVIANRALEIMGEAKGNYQIIDPVNDINLYQSTNDTYPTALKIASIILLRELEKNVI